MPVIDAAVRRCYADVRHGLVAEREGELSMPTKTSMGCPHHRLGTEYTAPAMAMVA